MSDEARRWPRVKALFDGALNLPSERRGAFLADACGGDDGLRNEVESLLAAHADAGSFAASIVCCHTGSMTPAG